MGNKWLTRSINDYKDEEETGKILFGVLVDSIKKKKKNC